MVKCVQITTINWLPFVRWHRLPIDGRVEKPTQNYVSRPLMIISTKEKKNLRIEHSKIIKCWNKKKRETNETMWPSLQPPANKLAIVVYLFTSSSIIHMLFSLCRSTWPFFSSSFSQFVHNFVAFFTSGFRWLFSLSFVPFLFLVRERSLDHSIRSLPCII